MRYNRPLNHIKVIPDDYRWIPVTGVPHDLRLYVGLNETTGDAVIGQVSYIKDSNYTIALGRYSLYLISREGGVETVLCSGIRDVKFIENRYGVGRFDCYALPSVLTLTWDGSKVIFDSHILQLDTITGTPGEHLGIAVDASGLPGSYVGIGTGANASSYYKVGGVKGYQDVFDNNQMCPPVETPCCPCPGRNIVVTVSPCAGTALNIYEKFTYSKIVGTWILEVNPLNCTWYKYFNNINASHDNVQIFIYYKKDDYLYVQFIVRPQSGYYLYDMHKFSTESYIPYIPECDSIYNNVLEHSVDNNCTLTITVS